MKILENFIVKNKNKIFKDDKLGIIFISVYNSDIEKDSFKLMIKDNEIYRVGDYLKQINDKGFEVGRVKILTYSVHNRKNGKGRFVSVRLQALECSWLRYTINAEELGKHYFKI